MFHARVIGLIIGLLMITGRYPQFLNDMKIKDIEDQRLKQVRACSVLFQ